MKKNDNIHYISKKYKISELLIKSEMTPIQLNQILSNNPSIVNSIDYKGETILSYALNNNNHEIFDLILNSPILNLNYKDNNGNSYLHLAVMNQNEKIVKTLIKKGINLNLQNNSGNTALHLAYEYTNGSIIKILTSNGINSLIKNKDNKIAKEIKGNKINKNKSVNYNNFLNKTTKTNKTEKNLLKPSKKEGNDSNNNTNNKYTNNNNILKVYSKYFQSNPYFIIKKEKESKNKSIYKNNHIELTERKKKKDNSSKLEECNNDNEDRYLKLLSFKIYNNNNKEEENENLKKNADNNLINNASNETKFITDTKEKTNNLDDISSLISQSIESKKCQNINEKEKEKNKNDYLNNYLLYNKNCKIEKKNKKKELRKNCKSFINLNVDKYNTIQNKYSPKNKTEKHTADNILKYKNTNNLNTHNDNKSNKKHKVLSNKKINKKIIKKDNSFISSTSLKNNFIKKNSNHENNNNNNIDINHILKKRNINRIKKKELFVKQTITNEKNKIISLNKEDIEKKNQSFYNNKNYIDNDENCLTLKSSKLLKSFLSQINMNKYMGLFAVNGFDDINLILDQSKNGMASIQDSELKEAGIKIPGDRAKILIRIQELSNNFIFPIPKEVYYCIKNIDNIDKDQNIIKLKEWLQSIKMEHYLMNFVNCGYYSLELLLIQMASSNPISNEILKDEIGIGKVGYRSRLINKLKEDSRSYIGELTINMLVINKGEGEEKTNNCQCIII